MKIKVHLVRSCSKEQESLHLKVLSSNIDRAEIDAFERPLLEERRGDFLDKSPVPNPVRAL
jgi:hypothetical protein